MTNMKATPGPIVEKLTIADIRPGHTLDKRIVASVREHCSDYANTHLEVQSADGKQLQWCFNSATRVRRVGAGEFITVRPGEDD